MSLQRGQQCQRTGRAGIVGIGLALTLVGCMREPETWVCPALAEGDLAISEIRGKQALSDSFGQWVELYNASEQDIDLRGLSVVATELSGAGYHRIVVRASDVAVAPGEYVVLGHHGPTAEDIPAFVDYSYFSDWYKTPQELEGSPGDPGETDGVDASDPVTRDQPPRPSDLHASGVLELYACDTLIDRVSYENLPGDGSYAFDGSMAPSAEANDPASSWCVDAEDPPDDDETLIGFGKPGTPGEANRPCL